MAVFGLTSPATGAAGVDNVAALEELAVAAMQRSDRSSERDVKAILLRLGMDLLRLSVAKRRFAEDYQIYQAQRHLDKAARRELDEIRSRLFSHDFSIKSHLFSVLVATERLDESWKVDHPDEYREITHAIFGSSALPSEGAFANPMNLRTTPSDQDAIAGLLTSAETDQVAANGVFRSMLRIIRATDPVRYAY